MPIKVLKSRGPCSANYPYWLTMIIPMLSLNRPTPLNIPLPCRNLTCAQLPITQTGIAFWREAAAGVAAEWGGPPPQQRSFNQGQPDYRRLKCVEGVSLGLAYNSDRAR